MGGDFSRLRHHVGGSADESSEVLESENALELQELDADIPEGLRVEG